MGTVETFDHTADVGLRVAKAQLPAAGPQPAGDERKVQHERGVGEAQISQVDDHVVVRPQRAGQRRPPAGLGRKVLVTAASQHGGLFAEVDDDAASYTQPRDTLKGMVGVEEVEEALTNVIDPELGLDFVELGLIYGVEIDEGDVHVTFTLTSPGCPIGPQVSEQIEEFVGELDGVEAVTSSMVFDPPWTPDKMSEDAKFALGF
jgi:metal-sulfur cluster biosynthetic enzyme